MLLRIPPLLLALAATPALAHPGHGSDGVLHWFTADDHFAALMVTLAVIGLVLLRRRALRRPRTSRRKPD